jgi:hypothetical protein
VPLKQVSRAITELIKRGVFSDQIDGVVVRGSAYTSSSVNDKTVPLAQSEPAEISDTTAPDRPEFP